ncbi:MAG: MEDS domain-containing protein, partial [Longimicrobiales bacterium]
MNAPNALSTARAAAAESTKLQPAGAPGHRAQFYESDEFPCEAVTDFLLEGLRQGEALFVIASDGHRDAIARRLEANGFHAGAHGQTPSITFLEATEALSTFMTGSMLDEVRFKSSIGQAIERSRGRQQSLRTCGEMVDLLCREGNHAAAIRVEELWDELVRTHSISLLCTYSIDNFGKESETPAFHEVCSLHSQVIPAKTGAAVDEDVRAREICHLQQRARV